MNAFDAPYGDVQPETSAGLLDRGRADSLFAATLNPIDDDVQSPSFETVRRATLKELDDVVDRRGAGVRNNDGNVRGGKQNDTVAWRSHGQRCKNIIRGRGTYRLCKRIDAGICRREELSAEVELRQMGSEIEGIGAEIQSLALRTLRQTDRHVCSAK